MHDATTTTRPPSACPSWCGITDDPESHPVGAHVSRSWSIYRSGQPTLFVEGSLDGDRVPAVYLAQEDETLESFAPAHARSLAAALVAAADLLEAPQVTRG